MRVGQWTRASDFVFEPGCANGGDSGFENQLEERIDMRVSIDIAGTG